MAQLSFRSHPFLLSFQGYCAHGGLLPGYVRLISLELNRKGQAESSFWWSLGFPLPARERDAPAPGAADQTSLGQQQVSLPLPGLSDVAPGT